MGCVNVLAVGNPSTPRDQQPMRSSLFGFPRITLAWIGAALMGLSLMALCVLAPARASATTFLPTTWMPGQTIVSLTFDDGWQDDYEARSILADHGMHGLFYLISGWVNNYPEFMTWEEAKGLYAEGNEIGGHTVFHPHLTELELPEVEREICYDRDNLLNEGFQPTDFAYPYGQYNPTIEQIPARCGYDSARTTNDFSTENCTLVCSETIPPQNPYATGVVAASGEYGLEYSQSVSQIENEITKAENDGGGWVQIIFHQICEGCESLATTPAQLSALLDWLEPRTAKGTSVHTVQEVIGGPVKPAVTPALPPAPNGNNTVKNPNLEEEGSAAAEEPPNPTGPLPACFQTDDWGENTAVWTRERTTEAHDSSYAEKLTVSNYKNGSDRLVTAFDLGHCTPTVIPGHQYVATEWYKSTVPVEFGAILRSDEDHFDYWTGSQTFPASSEWTEAKWTTPVIPSGVNGLSFGLGVVQNGTLAVDDIGLHDANPTGTPTPDTVPPTSVITCNNEACLSGNYSAPVSVGLSAWDNTGGSGVSKIVYTTNGSTPSLTNGTVYSGPFSIRGSTIVNYRAYDNAGNAEAVNSQTINVVPEPANLLQNPNLETLSAGVPVCWTPVVNGSGLTGTWSNTSETHDSSNAELASVISYSSGDLKLVSQQDAVLKNPTLTSATASSSGGQLAADTYYYEITATSKYGETLPSQELSATTTGTTGSVRLVWPAISSGALTGYRIYRATASGQETLLASVGSSETSFTDTGSATPGSTRPPTGNRASKVATCAPVATPGDIYAGSAWYKSSPGASVRFVVYYRSAAGEWVFWKSDPLPASTTWTQADLTTEKMPAGATALSFGMSLYSTGTLDVDDLSLGDLTATAASTPPSSYTLSPAYSNTPSVPISYTAIKSPDGSELARVELYAKGPADTGYTKVATNTGTATSGTFSYAALEGQGTYSFYTIATDEAGNVQATPASPNSTTLLDTTAPTSNASSPALSNSTSFSVSYTASDNPGGSGLAEVDLYAQAPGQSSYSKVASNTSGSSSGSFSYSATNGDGTYSFYTIATDEAGNVQATPSSPNSTTLLDSTPPTSAASSPATTNSTSFSVSYTASDPGGSGLAEVDLYAQAPGQSSYSKVASNTSGSSSGSFSYTATAGQGTYSFYTIATDKAGNVQATPSSPNSTTLLDSTPPTSAASSPATTNSTSFSVSYTASDPGGSGPAEVDLYAKGPGDLGYTKVATNTGTATSGTFSYAALEGGGTYSFYTIATDEAGNVQATPSSPNSTTLLDTTPPTSAASSPATTNSTSFSVSYTASDPGGSGLAEVDLYAQAPGQSSYSKVASDTSGSSSGSFSYSATAGQGTYSFYTIATDEAGNSETAPSSPETTTLLDTTPPTSAASSPATTNSTSFSVSYTASDSGGSGLAEVDLYAQAPGQSSYSKVASDTSGSSSGSFSYTATAGQGTYSFYTIATDEAGNSETAPSSPETTTLLDTTPPTSAASSPATTNSTSFSVSYTASDSGGSGLAEVDLYAQAPGQSSYSKVASNTSGSSSGSFTYTATAGQGTYSFYTIAADKAGNVQATPASPNSTTLLDTTAPTSNASAPTYSNTTSWTVSYTASDTSGPGLAEVDLYAQAPGQSSYSKVASDTSGSSSGSFSYTATAGQGTYSFYTIATDEAGNSETAPSSPETTTLLDTTPPTSAASSPATTNSTSFSVSYTASDPGGSGLAEVDLYAQAPGQSSYSKVASDTSGSSSGSFSYSATNGDGTYSFYTIATDKAGNVQATPASPNSTTLLDTTAPTSNASSPTLSNSTALTVSYTASDNPGGSGLAEVDLYAQAPGQSSYSKVASDTSGSSSGSFSYSATNGDGTYSFYTIATDEAGNVQATPASPNSTTLLDTTPPTSNASSPALSNSTALTVSYTASDNPGGSGLAEVDLYAQAPGQSSYSKVASNTSGSSSGSFSYTATAGQGTYSFYTIATDKAGNVQATPASPNSTTLLDTTAPTSNASSPALSNSTALTVSYTASDTSGPGLAEVDLYAQAPGQSSYSKVASNTSGSSSGSFSYSATNGDGTYSFYTIATDKAGNVQATPSSPNSTTLLDTTPPTSAASSPATTNSTAMTVSYTASDPGGSGLAEVDLYAQAPRQSSYSKVASNTSGSSSGSFSYTATAGQGTYSFYTIATDKAGNVQATPASPNSTTLLDTTAPTSNASAPTYSNTTSWTVSYTASDNSGGSGLASVALWARLPGASTYVKAATNTGSATSGSFTYTATGGDGSYAFYTIATDKAGNVQATPGKPNATTTLDTVAPSAFEMTNLGQYLRATVTLSLSSAPTDAGSGMASVTYQYRVSGSANAWSTACKVTASPWSCSWNTKATPDGSYEVRAVAADRAGNTTVASNTPLTGITIENTTPTAKSISTSNVSGGTVGKAQTGDSMTFTYSTTMNPNSILAGWPGAATAVQVKFVAKTATDTTLTVWNSAGTVQLALANPLNLGGNYVPSGGAVFNATMVQNGAAITVTLGSLVSGGVQAAAVTGGTLTWTPSASATDLAGNKSSTTSVSAPGPAF